jgi:hypothetical protein
MIQIFFLKDQKGINVTPKTLSLIYYVNILKKSPKIYPRNILKTITTIYLKSDDIYLRSYNYRLIANNLIHNSASFFFELLKLC